MKKKKLTDLIQILTGLFLAAVMVLGIVFFLHRYLSYGEKQLESGHAGEAVKRRQEQTKQMDTERNMQHPDAWKPDKTEDGSQDGIREIRVRLLSSDYMQDVHEQFSVTSEKPFSVTHLIFADKETRTDSYAAGTYFQADADTFASGTAVCIEAEEGGGLLTDSIQRAGGSACYAGRLFLYPGTGGLTVVNELPLEEYLASVVSSEIPSDYPLQAQKAQAVCARTYARNCMKNAEKQNSFTDLDDSVNFQVYNNYASTDSSRAAVARTRGEILPLQEVLYFSTSCQSEERTDLGSDEAFAEFLAQEPKAGAEYDSPWLRWEAVIAADTILQNASRVCGVELEQLDDIQISKRHGNGQAQTLVLTCGSQTYSIEGEYKIRQVLSVSEAEVTLMDGTRAVSMQLLPSAFFVFEKNGDAVLDDSGTVRLLGGGYGHGIGMSQCGAAAMAADGKTYHEILKYYYGVEPEESMG